MTKNSIKNIFVFVAVIAEVWLACYLAEVLAPGESLMKFWWGLPYVFTCFWFMLATYSLAFFVDLPRR